MARETLSPPAFGKECAIASRSSRCACAVILFVCTLFPIVVPVSALDVRLNGSIVSSGTEFARYARPHAADGRRVRGVSLGELVPLMFEVAGVEIDHAEGVSRLSGSRLVEDLFEIVVFHDSEAYHLAHSGMVYRDLSGVAVQGETIEVDDLSVWLSWEGTDMIETELRRFGGIFGLSVDTTTVPDTGSRLSATERARGEQADVVLIQSDYLPDLLEFRTLQPLGNVRAAQARDPAVTAFLTDGQLWARSVYFDSHLVFYNPELVSTTPRADWSLAELESEAQRLRGHVEVPLAWNAYSAYWLSPFVLGYGKDALVDADGRVRMNDRPTQLALERILAMVDRGTLIPMERDAMTSYFTSGRAAFILTGSYSIPSFERLGIPFAVTSFPRIRSTGRAVAPFLDFKGFAVTRRTRHPILARRLVEYLSSPAVQAAIALPTRKMPASPSAWPLVEEGHPYAQALMESYRIGVPVPNTRGYTTYKSLMWRMLRFVFDGRMSVEAMLLQSDRMLTAQ